MARTFELHVEMENGDTYDVVADQRDAAKFEVQEFGCSTLELATRISMAYRFMAWSALCRRDAIKLKWPEFNETCVEVIDMPDDDEASDEDTDVEDPGQPAPSA